jgi:hypothetical protein
MTLEYVILTNNQVNIASNLIGQRCHPRLGQKDHIVILDIYKMTCSD